MDVNQEQYVVPFWSSISDLDKELFREGVDLLCKIKIGRRENDAERYLVYQQIIKHNGRIPENLEFTELCRRLHINPYQLSDQLHVLLITIIDTVGTTPASEILWLPPREVRRLIANKVLHATKVGKHWSMDTIEVLRLAAKRLEA